MLLETKAVLQQQLEGWRARSDKLHQLEKHSLLLNARVHVMEQVNNMEYYAVDYIYVNGGQYEH